MANIVQVPGIGQDVQQAFAPLIQVLRQRNALAQQQAQQEQQLAAHLFATGLQTPGFETSDTAQQLEMKLGVPGLGKSISQARTREQKLKMQAIDELVTNMAQQGLTPGRQAGLRASLAAKVAGASAEVSNSLYSAFAGDEDLSPLEAARIADMNANAAKTLQAVDLARRHNDPDAQRQAAAIIGNTGDRFNPGIDYVDVVEALLKDKETDPKSLVIRTAMTLITQSRDMLGRPGLTPTEALNEANTILAPFTPTTVRQTVMTPAFMARLEATSQAYQAWQAIEDRGGTNPLTNKKYKSDADRWKSISDDLKSRFPTLDDATLSSIFTVIMRRAHPIAF